MTTDLSTTPVADWRARTCLLCHAEQGHTPTCPTVVPDEVDLLVEDLPGGAGTRTWTLSGLKYNATAARRARFVAAGPAHLDELRWHHACDKDAVPFSMGHLLKAIVPQLGISKWLARYAFSPLGVVRVADCNCETARCRCDFPGHPFGQAEPDFWPSFAPLVLRLRQPAGWWDWWMLDTGMGAVVVCQDDITNDPAPAESTRACAMGWCHLCPATMAPLAGEVDRRPCQHTCGHPRATVTLGAQS